MKKLKFILFITVLIWSGCTENELIPPQQENQKWNVKEFTLTPEHPVTNALATAFSGKINGRTLSSADGVIDMSQVTMSQSDNLERYTLNIHSEEPGRFSNVVVDIVDGDAYINKVSYIPDPNWIYGDGEKSWINFTGTIEVTDTEGSVLRELRAENGEQVASTSQNGRTLDQECTWVVYEQTTDWYVNGSFEDSTSEVWMEFSCGPSSTNTGPTVGGLSGGSGSTSSSGDTNSKTALLAANGCIDDDCPAPTTVPELPEDGDPDFKADCDSWAFNQTGPDYNYQAAGVSDIEVDILATKLIDDKLALDYRILRFDHPLYFEYPRIRADGSIISRAQAANVMARAHDLTHEAVDAHFSNKPFYSTAAVEIFYKSTFRAIIKAGGGRLTDEPMYGGITVRKFSSSIFGNRGC